MEQTIVDTRKKILYRDYAHHSSVMKRFLIPVALGGFLAGVVVPSFATTSTETVHLTPEQSLFIQDLDDALGTKFHTLAETTAAVPFLQTAKIFCGNPSLTNQVVEASGKMKAEMQYALNRFDSAFCS